MSASLAPTPLPPDQAALESQADRLLAALPRDPGCACYTEGQLAARYRRVVSISTLDEAALAPPTVAQRDEIRFLAAVSRLAPLQRLCVDLWADGWSVREIALRLDCPPWRLSRTLRCALRRCFDATPVSFRLFSHHTVYRPPSHARRTGPGRRCLRCGEQYLPAFGSGRYCSSACRAEIRGERARLQRNNVLTSRARSGMMETTTITGREQRNQLDPVPGLF